MIAAAVYERVPLLVEAVKRAKSGAATLADEQAIYAALLPVVARARADHGVCSIALVPRRAPGAHASLAAVGAHLCSALGVRPVSLARVARPMGGVVRLGRCRFAAREHARTMACVRVRGPVLVLDDVATTGATMAGACAAVRAAGVLPIACALLLSGRHT